MISFLKKLWKPKYESLNEIRIEAEAIRNNITILQAEQPDCHIIPVLKSNAYGHGLEQIARILESTSIGMIAVDSFPEANILYKHSSKKLLILGECSWEQYQFFHF